MALQALYQQEITGETLDRALHVVYENFEASRSAREFAATLVHIVTDRRADIDALIVAACQNWRLERLSKVDLNILRLAIGELLAVPPMAPSIVINEAIELARRFGSQESTMFVNGVLDEVSARLGLKAEQTGAKQSSSDEEEEIRSDEVADKVDG